MAHSHREHGQDKTVLSCLVGVGGVNGIGDKSRLSATENFETVLSSLEMRCELSLSCPDPVSMVTYCDVIWKLVHKCVHTADKTKLFCLQYI